MNPPLESAALPGASSPAVALLWTSAASDAVSLLSSLLQREPYSSSFFCVGFSRIYVCEVLPCAVGLYIILFSLKCTTIYFSILLVGIWVISRFWGMIRKVLLSTSLYKSFGTCADRLHLYGEVERLCRRRRGRTTYLYLPNRVLTPVPAVYVTIV